MTYSSSIGEPVATRTCTTTRSSIEDRQASTGADLLLSLAETATAAALGNKKHGGSNGSVTPSPVSTALEEMGVSGKGVKSASANMPSSPVTVSSGTAPTVPSHLESVDAQEPKKRAGSVSGIDQIVAASIKRARAERIVTNDDEESREGKASDEQARDSSAEKKDGGNDQQNGAQPVISPSSSDEAQQTPAQGEVNNIAQSNGSGATCHQPPFYPPHPYYPNPHHGFGRPMHYMQPTPYGHPAYGYAPPLPYYGLMPARVQPPMAPAGHHSSRKPPPAASPSPPVAVPTAAAAPAAASASTAPATTKQPRNYQAALQKDHTDLKKNSSAASPSVSNRCVPLEHPLPTRSWR